MVDASLLYWALGRIQESIAFYCKAADLSDPAARCNLGITCLQPWTQPPKPKEAVRWLYLASIAGHIRAQYHICNLSPLEQARWYLQAAEGGYARAMYNVWLCYSVGEGLAHSYRQTRKWMKRAAVKAQFDHGHALFSVCKLSSSDFFIYLSSCYHYFFLFCIYT
ncbi:Sel1 domain-containing protein [Cephalotus follicularis]|uniref:Sel1 domain-containing protein n=1 Tax=Cephalotus follicularis TaxID=3775 RepID=A0A1Q3CFC8_CEPFO|nr:Sel1 domain-containing protein [Cephalotus follicularis]